MQNPQGFYIKLTFAGTGHVVEEGHHLSYEAVMVISMDASRRGLHVGFGPEFKSTSNTSSAGYADVTHLRQVQTSEKSARLETVNALS